MAVSLNVLDTRGANVCATICILGPFGLGLKISMAEGKDIKLRMRVELGLVRVKGLLRWLGYEAG